MMAAKAFELATRSQPAPGVVLDVGPGDGTATKAFEAAGYTVEQWTLADNGPIERIAEQWTQAYDIVWCSHVLEHTHAPIAALRGMARMARGGILAVTVPPLKPQIVGGHVNLYYPGLLLYQAVLAGMDLGRSALYVGGYDISLVVREPKLTPLPPLRHDCGDIETLAARFPPWLQARQDFDGRLATTHWHTL